MAITYRQSIGSRVFDVANYAVVIIVAASALFPFLHMAAISVSDFFAVGYGEVVVVPVDFSLKIYDYLFQYNPFIFRAYFNSLLYTVLNTFFTLLLCSMGGFALAQTKLAFRGLWGVLLLVTMFFSGGLIPQFLWYRELGLFDTIWAIVLPTAVSAFYVFLFRVFILSNVSTELLESVYVDGGGDSMAYFRIVLPLIKPMLATIGLWAAVGMWNSFFSALIYLSDRKMFPLTLFLREMVVLGDFGGNSRGRPDATGQEMTAYEMEMQYDVATAVWLGGYLKASKMAFTLVTVVPILFVYPFAQRYFVKGIQIGALKG